MGLGSTAKKLQRVADLAEDLMGRLNELRERVTRVEESLDGTERRLADVETELHEQRALLEAVATAEGVDVEAVLAEAETVDQDADTNTDAAAGAGGTDGEPSTGAALSPDETA